jgi:hypothetical protein
MRSGGCSTATGTGCDLYVALAYIYRLSEPAASRDRIPDPTPDIANGGDTLRRRISRMTTDTDGRRTRATLTGMQAPEIQTMYTLNMPVSMLRTKMRQEFERHRYVNQIKTVDVLLFNSHQEYQETLNFWKQLSHVLKYFRAEEDPKARLPANFIEGFLEVCFISNRKPGTKV